MQLPWCGAPAVSNRVAECIAIATTTAEIIPTNSEIFHVEPRPRLSINSTEGIRREMTTQSYVSRRRVQMVMVR